MARPVDPASRRELDELRELLLALCEFQRRVLDSPFADRMVEGVEKAYRARSLPGLRMARNDMLSMLEGCTADQLRQLDALLRERTDTSVAELRARQLARIARIQERGRISNDEQYYLVREHVELIWDDPAKNEELTALQALLADYENRRGRMAGKR
ncbi:MAG: hypothetical protein ACJ8J0_21065 [Longimicrobiaceae bacterium]